MIDAGEDELDLYVVRHAIAEPRSPRRVDAGRALTGRGRRRFALAAGGLVALGVELDLVLHSPWTRAAQTAAMLAPVARGPLRASEALAADPGPGLLEVVGREAAAAGARAVAVVGHEPWLGELVAWLATGDAGLGAAFPLRKGGVAWLQGPLEPGRMELRAAWPPRTLRALGRSG